MEVGMVHGVLTPSVQDADHPDRGAEMFRVLGEFQEGLGGRTKKQIVEDLPIHQNQGIEFGGEGEDYMEVFNGQEVLTARLDPLLFP
jgi:hypothetical protein